MQQIRAISETLKIDRVLKNETITIAITISCSDLINIDVISKTGTFHHLILVLLTQEDYGKGW